eukprot:GILK01004030.1.p1 GENE.GILK01004030.1~~GILK01004030.1.p1  ORF type:complete len:446 (-),score=71.76 GILK01004030.1:634-1914(-)
MATQRPFTSVANPDASVRQAAFKTSRRVLGGLEGGGTNTVLVLLSPEGMVLTKKYGGSSNQWLIGLDQTVSTILELVREAKAEIKMAQDEPLVSLGLCMSGLEQEEQQLALMNQLYQFDPFVASSITAMVDSVGSIYAGSASGGMVLIAGTGSIGMLLTPEDELYRCGGWGHMIGDEGSGYHISSRAINIVFRVLDGMKAYLDDTPQPNVDYLWGQMKRYFNIRTQDELLDVMYRRFEKSYVAGLCSSIAEGANACDQFCIDLFQNAGQQLGHHAATLLPHYKSSRIQILCVGSVFKSFNLLKDGFLSVLDKEIGREWLPEIVLSSVVVESAIGAAYLAARQVSQPLHMAYSKMVETFYVYNNEEKRKRSAKEEQRNPSSKLSRSSSMVTGRDSLFLALGTVAAAAIVFGAKYTVSWLQNRHASMK